MRSARRTLRIKGKRIMIMGFNLYMCKDTKVPIV